MEWHESGLFGPFSSEVKKTVDWCAAKELRWDKTDVVVVVKERMSLPEAVITIYPRKDSSAIEVDVAVHELLNVRIHPWEEHEWWRTCGLLDIGSVSLMVGGMKDILRNQNVLKVGEAIQSKSKEFEVNFYIHLNFYAGEASRVEVSLLSKEERTVWVTVFDSKQVEQALGGLEIFGSPETETRVLMPENGFGVQKWILP